MYLVTKLEEKFIILRDALCIFWSFNNSLQLINYNHSAAPHKTIRFFSDFLDFLTWNCEPREQIQIFLYMTNFLRATILV